jgi:hypothetical protein
MSDNEVNPSDQSLLKKRQVSPLPIGPGGDNSTKREMNETNTRLTMLMAQADANTKYDPPVPEPVTKPLTIESFESGMSMPAALMVVGVLFIVYGFVAK